MIKMNEQQTKVIETEESKVVVLSAAASGKTQTMTERTRFLIKHGFDPQKIVVITFTNAAADMIAERLGSPKGLFIGTIHSYANYLLTSIGVKTGRLIEQEKFDEFFKLVKKNPDCIREVDHLLLDEAQDSDEKQLEFILDMVKPHNWMLCGDIRQSIYRWKGSRPDLLIDLMKQEGVKTYKLYQNYRNGKTILQFAKNLLRNLDEDYYDDSLAMSDVKGNIIEVEYSPAIIIRAIKSEPNYRDWFILARTNSQVDEILYHLTDSGIPCSTFKRSQLSNSQFKAEMEKDSVKVLTVHSAKGLEAKNVIVVGVGKRNRQLEENCVAYVAATRAKENLVWTYLPKKNKRKSFGEW